MKITKVINNNVVSSVDNNGIEIVVMGRGIGFRKRENDELEEEKIQKIFRFSGSAGSKFEKLVEDMSYETILTAEKIITYAQEQLHCELGKNIYITLTDHLNYALERQKKGYTFENAFLWEIKNFYPQEYSVGRKGLEIVWKELGVQLPEDEAGFLALHVINAEIDGNLTDTMDAPVMLKNMLNIIRYTFDVQFDEDSLSYERLVTHLKFFLHRLIRGECYETEDENFNHVLKERYPREYRCAKQIAAYVEEKQGVPVSDEELIYLTIHIYRVTKREKNKETEGLLRFRRQNPNGQETVSTGCLSCFLMAVRGFL